MDLGFTWAGWRHAFFAEIEPFGRAVLAARFPGVPIYSDVRDVPECGSGVPWGVTVAGSRVHALGRASVSPERDRGDADAAVRQRDERHASPRRLDVLTFGSPCQDLSVAGKRRGLDGDRSGLFWEAMRIAGDGPVRPRALLMENVEGLLSSNGGRDFALVLDAMAERGYRWSYRVLDSQHFGVPQRRRRVFVLAIADDDPGAERIAAVLALGEGSGGDSPTSDPSWPLTTARAGEGAPGGGGGDAVIKRERERSGGRERDHVDDPVRRGRLHGAGREPDRAGGGVVSALQGGGKRGHRVDAESAAGGHLIPISPNAASPDVAGTMTSPADGSRTTDLGPAFVCQGDGIISAPEVASTLQAQHGRGFALNAETADRQLVAFRKSARVNADPESAETWVDDGLANTLNSFDVGDVRTTHAVVQATAFAQKKRGELRESEIAPAVTSGGGKPGEGYSAARVGPAVRRLTPLECERLQAWPEVDGRGWTEIPWNGKEHAPDSKRYAACGNGVTSTVAYWIAARLAEVLK